MIFQPGEHFESMRAELDAVDTGYPGFWRTLGLRGVELEPGRVTIEWDASEEYGFPSADGGRLIHGGMIAALLDQAMGSATWSLLNNDQVFLAADLRTEFFRPTPPGTLRAKGWVMHKTRRITFAAGELYGPDGKLLASGRATNITIELES